MLVNDCGSTTLPEKEIWAGAPVISYFSAPTYTPNNKWTTNYAQPNDELMRVTAYFLVHCQSNGNVIYDYGWTADVAFYNSGNYQLVARSFNQCQWGDYAVTGIEVYDAKRLLFTPNSATGETTLSIESTSEQKMVNETVTWELEVYDNTQNLKLKDSKIKGKEYRFNTTGWKEGIYVARVKYKDEILTGKLVVKNKNISSSFRIFKINIKENLQYLSNH